MGAYRTARFRVMWAEAARTLAQRPACLVAGLVLVLTTSRVNAQVGSMRVTLPSPTAATLGKFGDVPVNLYTGVPDISIPLFTAKGRTLELPIALKYHAGGLRVEEIGGWTGMGWTLEAGGVITRTVRGLADETANGYYNTGHHWYGTGNWPTPPSNLITDILAETKDGEPDQFFFSFAGRSGQFVMGPTSTSPSLREYRAIPHQKLRIVPSIVANAITAWSIQTEDGTRYTFTATETNTDFNITSPAGVIPAKFGDAYVSAWQLTQITSPGGDIITLTYSSATARHRVGGYVEKFDQVVSVPPTPACVPAQFDVTTEYEVTVQRIATITSAAHTIDFHSNTLRTDALSPSGAQQERRLDSIVVKTPGGTRLRVFRFEYDYSLGRLTLKNLYERDPNGVSLPPYTFTYNAQSLPAINSFAQDHWGFYNARTSNTTLIPPAVTPSGSVLSGGDRSPDSVAMRAGVLTRITYPTGGYNEFVYEANDYGAISSAGTAPLEGGAPQTIEARSDNFDGPVSTPFTVGGTQTVIATVTVTLDPACGPLIGCPYAEIPGKGFWIANGTYYVSLAPGSYTATASEEFFPGFALITVEWEDVATVKKKLASGLRVAEIRTADAMGAIVYRKYKYTTQADPAKSSGVISAEPTYWFQYNSSNCSYFSRSSASRMPLGGGPVVGYSEVTVWQGTTGQYGTTRHTFRSVLDQDDDPLTGGGWPFFKRTSKEWKRAQTKGTWEYTASGQLQQHLGYRYAFRDEGTPDTASTRRFKGISVHSFSGGEFGSLTQSNGFEVIAAWTYPDADTTVAFDTLGTNSFTTTRTYTRGNSKHLQVTESIETNSDNTQRVTRMKYPADYATGSGNAEAVALTAMQDTVNIHAAVIERYVLKRVGGVDSVVQGEVTSFKLYGAGTTQYLPYQRFAFNNPNPLPIGSYTVSSVSGGLFTKDSRYLLEETANTYDTFGRLTQLTDARSKVTNYLYGGNPNTAFLTKVTKVKDGTGPIDLVTDVAYDANQNVSSIKDEGGTFRNFTYDLFGRLRTIRNHGSTPVRSYGYTYSRTSPSWTFNPASPNAVIDTTWIAVGTSVPATQYLDGLGRTLQTQVKEGTSYHVSASEYDAMGRPWRTWKPYTRTTAGYDASYSANATSFYNTYLGQSQAKPYVETLYRAEAMNRVAQVIPEYVGASPTIVTRQGYGVDVAAKQQITEATDESGKKTRNFADVFGNGVKTILGFGAAEATTTTFQVSVLGQRTRVTDPRSLNTTYVYDTRGLLTSRTSPDAGTAASKYDFGRNLRFAQDAKQAAAGQVAFTGYDFANRPLTSGVGTATFSALDPNAAPGTLETTNTNWLVVRAYDAKPSTAAFPWSRFSTQITPLTLTNVAGRLAAVASKSNNAWQVTLFSYDTDGRVAKRWIYTEANGGASVLTNLNTSVTYTRDLRDALTQRVQTTGASSWYQWQDYDSRGLLWKVFGSTTSTKPGTADVTYTYRPSGEIATRLFSGGSSVPLTYTIREQLDKIGDPATTTYPFSARYTYNPNSTISEAEFYSAGSPATQKRYRYQFPTYDALNRLKSADHSSWSGSAWTTTLAYDLANINYDASGNLTGLQRYKETAAPIDNLTYTVAGTSNRLTSIADAVGVTTENWDAEAGSFTYDANGNVLTTPGPWSVTASTYDPRNLPLSLTIAGTTTNYRYDDGGQRITKQVGAGNTEVYLREGAVTLGVFTVNSGGTVTSSYFNLLAGDRVVGRQPSTGSRSYYHTDLLGSTRAVLQGATVVESYDFDPWGLLMPGRTLGSGTKERFTSKERDGESQLDYFGARYYLAALGRWGQVDPAPFADRMPEWSPYSYVKNEPSRSVDANGECPICIAAAAVIVGSAVGLAAHQVYENYRAGNDLTTGVAEATLAGARSGATSVLVGLGIEVAAAGVVAAAGGTLAARTVSRAATTGEGVVGAESRVAASAARRGGRVEKVGPTEGAGPHSGFKRDPQSGRVTGYTEFDAAGNPVKRFRGEGKPHGGVDPPLVLEPKPGKGPGSPPNRARPARPDEIPGGGK